MPAIVWGIGAIVVFVAAMLAVDWFAAGRAKRRVLVRGIDQASGSLGVGYAAVESNLEAEKYHGEAGV
jgi:hypothetical protein